ncbi:16S rRNA (cytidine(1402)-2'-O)-methyltransferase [Nitratireductor thuwali]|uniref:16S rRNA (cytidine(1402)-2'-O)-methyltransferase n=1 Tax=Nitratireductor thuwali TaxID=2267699 RepID=UPI0030D18110
MSERKAADRRHYVVAGVEVAAPPLEPALYLVATPIGNLSDITLRALQVLAGADIVACEDTRVTRVLLDRYGISRRTAAYHEHNAAEAGPRLLAAIEAGGSVALASDAGTPLISDPGFRLVERVQDAGLKVMPIPGPSAVLAALTASGLPTDAFMFGGFLPVKAGQRESRLQELSGVPATLVFFESPRRLASSLAAMTKMLGDRPAAVAREMTKAFEEVRRDGLAALAAHYAEAGAPKGEVVVCIGPPAEAQPTDAATVDRLLISLSREMPAAKAAGEAARMTGEKKSNLYQRLLALKGEGRGG